MKGLRYAYAGAVVAALGLALGLWNPFTGDVTAKRPHAPEFKVDPDWPKPLPNR